MRGNELAVLRGDGSQHRGGPLVKLTKLRLELFCASRIGLCVLRVSLCKFLGNDIHVRDRVVHVMPQVRIDLAVNVLT